MTTEKDLMMEGKLKMVRVPEEDKKLLEDIMLDVWKNGWNTALKSVVFNLRAEEMHDAADRVSRLQQH